jgi:hypothetical protein
MPERRGDFLAARHRSTEPNAGHLCPTVTPPTANRPSSSERGLSAIPARAVQQGHFAEVEAGDVTIVPGREHACALTSAHAVMWASGSSQPGESATRELARRHVRRSAPAPCRTMIRTRNPGFGCDASAMRPTRRT